MASNPLNSTAKKKQTKKKRKQKSWLWHLRCCSGRLGIFSFRLMAAQSPHPLKFATWSSSWTPLSPSSQKSILSKICLSPPQKHLLTGGHSPTLSPKPSSVNSSPGVWTLVMESCSGKPSKPWTYFTSTLFHLHWLPMKFQISYKVQQISTPWLPSTYLRSCTNACYLKACGPRLWIWSPPPAPADKILGTEPSAWLLPSSGTHSPPRLGVTKGVI